MSRVSHTKCKKCQKVAHVLKFQPHTETGYVCMDFQACFERQTTIRAASRQRYNQGLKPTSTPLRSIPAA